MQEDVLALAGGGGVGPLREYGPAERSPKGPASKTEKRGAGDHLGTCPRCGTESKPGEVCPTSPLTERETEAQIGW